MGVDISPIISESKKEIDYSDLVQNNRNRYVQSNLPFLPLFAVPMANRLKTYPEEQLHI